MSAGAAVLASFGSTQWDAQVYGSLSRASEIFGIIKDRGQALRVAWTLWRLNSEIHDMLEQVYAIMEGRAAAEPSDEPVTPERARGIEENVRRLALLMAAIYDEARRKRITNYSVLGGPLSRLKIFSDELLDLADWIADTQDEAGVNSAFDRSRAEQEKGEVFDLGQV